jgi:alpha-tubulin suppressor-like RCC1 family protein
MIIFRSFLFLLSMSFFVSTQARPVKGDLKCWGYNLYGQLGQNSNIAIGNKPNQMGDNLKRVDVGTGFKVKKVGGGLHACVQLNTHKVKCWGRNDFGQLGLGDTHYRGRGDTPNEMGDDLPLVDLGMGRNAKRIVSGSYHNCAILDNDKVKCWGYNANGTLGLGDTDNRGGKPNQMGDNLPYVNLGVGLTVKEIGANAFHNCVILDNDKVKCWGLNAYGQLGLGDTTNRGDNPFFMGDNLAYVDLGAGLTAKKIATAARHVCALLSNNKLKCWGENEKGQLGLGDTNNRGILPNQMGDNLPYVDLGVGRRVKQFTGGYYHTCAILDNNKVKCWGGNRTGQLGLGDQTNRGDKPNQMGDNLPYVDLGLGRTAKRISAGYFHTCALLDNDKVKCWGYNTQGQLGLGDPSTRGDLPGRMGDNLPYVDLGQDKTGIKIYSTSFSSCAVIN